MEVFSSIFAIDDIYFVHKSKLDNFIKSEFNEDCGEESNIPEDMEIYIDYNKYKKDFFEERGYTKITLANDIFYYREP
jgi:hypothetical protein